MMRAGLAAVGRPLAATLKHLASQIIVSVVTAVSVAALTNAYLNRDDASERRAPSQAALKQTERTRTGQATDGADVESNSATRAATALAPKIVQLEIGREPPSLPKLEAIFLPSLPVAAAVEAEASPTPLGSGMAGAGLAAATAAPDKHRRRLFGIPLPRPLADLGMVRSRVTGLFRGDEDPSGLGLH